MNSKTDESEHKKIKIKNDNHNDNNSSKRVMCTCPGPQNQIAKCTVYTINNVTIFIYTEYKEI